MEQISKRLMSWASILEDTTRQQAVRTATMPFMWGQSDAFLDEHPDAYKDIDVVMRDAADLVTVRHTLHQIVNVKGD